jgi:NitT/TauT family transport system substrate-binding protein
MEVDVRRSRVAWLSVVLLVAACGPGAPSAAPLTKLTVGLGYIPSVQFAQFYRAKVQGYYAAAGLDVTFQNGDDANLITLIAQGADDIGIADGTSVIPAVGQGIPIRYAATIYARFPNVVIVPAGSGISSAADLRGKKIGIPGAYGSSWIMLQALLSSASLTTADIVERDYSDYGQGIALQQGQVDAATAYHNNEPVQLGLAGFATRELTVDRIVPLPGPGLIVGTAILDGVTITASQKRDAVRAFVAATLRAMREIDANPQLGLDDTITVVPTLGSDRATQLAILRATIEMWHSPNTDAHGLGAIDSAGWTQSLNFMRGLPGSNIPATLTGDQLISTELLP